MSKVGDEGDAKEEQEARAFLRERYLQFLSTISGAEAEIKMYDDTNVKCTLRAADKNFENVIVDNLQTPHPPVIPHAILRTNDIISITLRK